MVDMNSDHIFEVPDTPDRIQQSTCPVPSLATRRGVTRAAGNPSPTRRIIFKSKSNSIQGQSSEGNAIRELPAPLDTDSIFRRAELVRLSPVTEDLEAKLSPPKLDRTTRSSVVNANGARTLDLDQRSSISNHLICRGTGGKSNSCQIREGQVRQRDASHRNIDFLGVGSDLPTIPVGKPRNRAKISTSNGLKEVAGAEVFSGSSPRDKRESINIKSAAGLSSHTQCDVPQRYVGQRKLVRNGCISPSNIVKRSVKADDKQETCSTSGVLHHPNPRADVFHKVNVIDLTDNSPTITRKGITGADGLTSENNMETRASQRFTTARAAKTLIPQAVNQASSSNYSEGFNSKGKEIIHDVMGTGRTGEANQMRYCPRAAVDSSFIVNDNSSGMAYQQGWRTTHNHTRKVPSSCEIESGSSGPSNQGHETGDNNNSISAATTTRPASLRNMTIKISKGKRKHTSSSYHPGESSSSLNGLSGSCLAFSDRTAGRNPSNICHDIPVIDIDDIRSPEVGSSLSGHSSRTLIDPNISAQLEADELLAQQLQEQLYSETPRSVPREEMDAIVAMSLQHEEDAQRTSRTLRRFRNNTRATRASRSSASQRAIRARYETAISHMQNAAPITLGLRAIVGGYLAPHIQPNIDLNDYDALLALDENNHQHTGASESQINNLPQSVLQSTSNEEPCAVCLENPSIGDTIRTLPCFHKFHQECIDEWLRRKKLCPVCKCGITRS
ncbi:uncharacterized protein LOC100837137 isoform X1 [Brachypodium distachyon]|uniref:RING-type domain-containing protein n=1 Tax=Brachypodium distachyon TaxID=15368 RepID=I1IZK4_BRADI|nr:uncharacterized protein LOC100837137 isoform X1 [Brachypodium distachyon]XP_024311637.1 uncharacterized protein LOC100837137 isoform X1 [Brachypodium distachyon]KQJ83527.1 hypothetical protein BRADI_5g15450v3 [Brachypodium distachyon]PNT61458.1 hypothetical protein BRADI_5g15450v3 [Brachypodium distachyon]|eukprot:XP_003580120.1 uncharacterized protein LOC100837137 isoform X1 [Brachypodium distachyon]